MRIGRSVRADRSRPTSSSTSASSGCCIGHVDLRLGGRDADRRARASPASTNRSRSIGRPVRLARADVPAGHAPLMMPAVLAGALLAFSLSLDNTIISSFVSTADASPWPVYVFSSLRSVLRPSIAAMSTLVLLLTLFALALGGDRAPPRRRVRRGSGRDDRRHGGRALQLRPVGVKRSGLDLVVHRNLHTSTVTTVPPGPLPSVPYGHDHRPESEDRRQRPGSGVHRSAQPDAGEDRPARDERGHPAPWRTHQTAAGAPRRPREPDQPPQAERQRRARDPTGGRAPRR